MHGFFSAWGYYGGLQKYREFLPFGNFGKVSVLYHQDEQGDGVGEIQQLLDAKPG